MPGGQSLVFMMTDQRCKERWLLTCEHGGNQVPDEYATLFRGAEAVLASHRGRDAGALQVFEAIAPMFGEAAFHATTTRLLVDLNRSLHHPHVFSEFTRPLPGALRADIAARWWRPWRNVVAQAIAERCETGVIVRHISVHSFTPTLNGQRRNAEIGLLYDPRRAEERHFCSRWQVLLQECGWRVRRNYPYRGSADGHTTALRRRFGTGYAGIELELNQALLPGRLAPLCADLGESLEKLRSEPSFAREIRL